MVTVRPLGEIGTKVLSVLLTIVLVVSLAPAVSAWADEDDATNESSSEALPDEVLGAEDDSGTASEASEAEPQEGTVIVPEGAVDEEVLSEGSSEEEQPAESESTPSNTQAAEEAGDEGEALLSVQSSDEQSLNSQDEADIPYPQKEASIEFTGSFGEGGCLMWQYWTDATLVIFGEGAMPSFEENSQPWYEVLGKIEHLVVEEGVSNISDNAFLGCSLMDYVALPDGLLEIGSHAFENNAVLTAIHLPDTVTVIGEKAFYKCKKLATVNMPIDLTEVKDSAFEECYAIANGLVFNKVENIGEKAFMNSSKVTSVTFNDGLVNIGYHAFWSCRLSKVTIPKTVKTIGDDAFDNISWGVEFENGIKSLDFGFRTWAPFPGGIRVIIPATVNKIPNRIGSFIYDCSSIEIDEGNPNYSIHDGAIYSSTDTSGKKVGDSNIDALYLVPTAVKGDFSVLEGAKVVDCNAFNYARNVTSIHIPASVEQIIPSGSTYKVYFNISSVTVDEANQFFKVMDGGLYSKDGTILYRQLESPVGSHRVRESVTMIMPCAYDGRLKEATELYFPDSITKIPYVYGTVPKLANCYIPASVTAMEYWIDNVSDLAIDEYACRHIFFGGTKEVFDSTWAGKSIKGMGNGRVIAHCGVTHYGKCDGGLEWCINSDGLFELLVDGSVSMEGERPMPDFAAGTTPWNAYRDEIKAVTISSHIASVGDYAFDGCENLEEVTLPSSIAEVGSHAFTSCPSLTSVISKGGPYTVFSADSGSPSFDVETVVINFPEGKAVWTNDSNYDAESGRWNGYKTGTFEQEEEALPEFKGRVVVREKANERGVFEAPDTLFINYYSSAGELITDKMDVTISGPAIEPLSDDYLNRFAWLTTNRGYDLRYIGYDSSIGAVETGGCVPAGTYNIIATPRAGEVTGYRSNYSFTITRDEEEVAIWRDEEPITVYGADGENVTRSIPLVYNQFAENITDDLTMRVIDKASGKDVTDSSQELGLSVESGSLNIDSYAQPRTYELSYTDTTKGRKGTATPRFEIKRSTALINRAYTLKLSGGEPEYLLDGDDIWSEIPYRTHIEDAYGDPCWPSVSWVVRKGSEDVSSYFEIDGQGYLRVKSEASALLDRDSVELTVEASSPKAVYYVDDTKRGGGYATDIATFVLKRGKQSAPTMHTATFKVGETVIGEVAFAEGDVSLDEPVLPTRENYLGAWDEYDLVSATGDIVVEGHYTPINPDEVSDISGESSAVYDNGAVAINLAAVATSKQVKVESSATKPVDVVLVLDQSGSMAETLGAGQTKRDALVQCANEFLQQLYDNAVKTGADHRVALVGFAYSNYNNGQYKNTGLLATANGSAKGFAQLTDADYRNALLPVAVNGSINQRVVAGVNSITAEGATAADVGLKMAKNVFSANPVAADENGAERERIVVFITDGVPTCWGSSTSLVTSTAAEAITMAQTIKQGQGARIYSVGVDAAANPSAAFTKYANGVRTASNGAFVSYDLNRFLHAVSSNYPEAAGMGNLGDGAQDGGFYLAVNDTSSLGKIFTSILYSKVYAIDTFDSATLTYTLPSYLMLTMKQEEEMRAALAEQGLSDDDIVVEPAADGTTKLTFKNVKVATEQVDGVPRYVAKVSFRVSATKDASGNVATGTDGSILFGGDAIDLRAASVDVPSDRCLLVFKVNDATYEIRDAAMGDAITLPDTNMARWLELEKLVEQDLAKVSEPYAVFETSTLTRAYNIRWVVGDNEMLTTLKPGEGVSVPDAVDAWVPDGYEIAGWSPSLPVTMPARNITCAAVVSPRHAHDYTYASYRTGSCDEGIVTHHVCICGDEQTEVASPKAHSYEAVLSQNGLYGSTVEKLVCADCGHSVDKNVTYTVSYSNGWRTAVLDLSKYENSVVQEGASSDAIAMRFYVGDASGKTYTVTRVDADGKRTTYTTKLENGYLTFDPDHFSIYVIDDGAEGDGLTYEECLAVLGNSEIPDVEGGPEVVMEDDPDAGDDGDEGDSSGRPSDAPGPDSPSGGGSNASGANRGSASGQAAISQASSAKSILSATVSGIKGKAYTGKLVTQAPVVKLNGVTLRAGVDYVLSYRNNLNVGIATMTITGKGAYTGTLNKDFTISKAKNTLKVKAKSPAVKASKLKKKAQAVAVKKALKISKAKGKVSYAKVKKGSSAKLSVNKKSGKITVKKGTKKGTYKVRVKVTAKGNANYKAASKTVTVKVRVK